MERIVLRKPLPELTEVGVFYKRLTGIDLSHVPEKYSSGVSDALSMLSEKTEVTIVYARAGITEKSETAVTLDNGISITGAMPPRVLKDALEVFGYVITLVGFDALKAEDMMVEYQIDSLGSAYVECAQAWLAQHIADSLAAEGLARTHLWSPGQHNFELHNQKALFAMLNPEEIGCSLSKRLMMIPVKSVSGIIGVVPSGTSGLLKPCDFCRFKATCPSSEKGCSVL